MRRRGHDVTVLSRSPDKSIGTEELDAIDGTGIRRLYIGEFAGQKLNYFLTLTRLLELGGMRGLLLPGGAALRRRELIANTHCRHLDKLDPEIIHIHYGTIADDVLRRDRDGKYSSRSIVTWHGYDFNAESVVAAHDGYSDLRRKAVEHTVGTWFSAGKLQDFGIEKSSIHRIPMGIDLAKFHLETRDYADTSVLKVLSVGRLVEVKGHSFLIRAIKEARNMGVPAHLRIIGDGPLRSQLIAESERLEVREHVDFLGAQPSHVVVKEMSRAHLFALTGVQEPTGKVENQGTVYCEAAAAGLPAIGTGIGGVPEAVIDGVTGKLCRPGGVAEIAAALQDFHLNRHLMATFGRSAREHAEQSLSLESMLDDFESLYRKVARQ
jgi:colanic acid/amylovoran biosynthesis glycosyltransferase